MAKFVLKHPKLDINGTNLEDHASSIEITTEYDEVDFTSFCSDFKEMGQGMGDCTWSIDFYQDFASGKVDAVLWPLSQSGGTFLVKASAGSAAVSATNPMYSMTARLFNYSPIAGAVGEASSTSTTLRNGSSSGLTRAIVGTV